MVPLAHAHGPAGFHQADLHAELGKGLDEDLGGGERAEIHHGAGPVKNGGLQLLGVLIVHGKAPVGKNSG